MKKFGLISLIFFISTQCVLASDFNQNIPNMATSDNLDIESTIGPELSNGFSVFEGSEAKIIRTKNKGGWFKRRLFTKKNKSADNEKSSLPEIIDYDYNPETEEITPIYKQEEPVVNAENFTNDEGTLPVNKVEITKASNIDIYCDNMDYNPDKQEIIGTGNVKIVSVENNSVMTAKKIIYNHDLNYIEGIDDVKITRDGQVLEGDYVKLDMNLGNAMIENPSVENHMIKIVAKSGKATTDTIEIFDGYAQASQDFEKRLFAARHASVFQLDLNEKLYRQYYPKDYRKKDSKYHIKTKELYVNSTDGHDTLTFKNADVYAGKALLLKGTDMTLSTDKSESFVETTLPVVGTMRYVGAFAGPSFVFNTPKSSTLKLAPIVALDGGDLGLGIYARFRQKYNDTLFVYNTAADEIVARGKQKLGDSDFQIEYAHMSYMSDWYFGSSLSKYLAQLAYQKRYIMPDLGMTFGHRATAGYLTDLNGEKGTARFRYQAMFTKSLVEYHNPDNKFYGVFELITQGMMGVYGTGDSNGVFRVGPSLRTQYRGWGQQIAYYQAAVAGQSPLKYTDAYRYGKATIQLIETFRINKYLSLGYLATLNLSNDDYLRDDMFSESRIAVSFGPDDARLSLGYDMIRQATMLSYTALVGSKNQDISFKRMFIKNPNKLGQDKNKKRKKETVLDENMEYNEYQNVADKEPYEENGFNEATDAIQDTLTQPSLFNFGGFGF